MNDLPIIEGIKVLGFSLRVRDRETNEVHELELRGRGPWDFAKLEEALGEAAATARPKHLPPPDDAITLKLDNREGKGVRVGATGSGAKAWTEAQGTLLGARWFLDARGAPIVLLDDSPSLIADIEKALPKVTIDTTHYTVAGADTAVVVAATPRRERARKPAAVPTEAPPAKKVADTTPPPAREAAPRSAEKPAASKAAGATPPASAPEAAPKSAEKPARRPEAETPKSTDEPASDDKPRAKGDRKKPRQHKQLTPGLGAGNLTWHETGDADNPGIVASWKDGQFKILHAGGDVYALFYERDREGKAGYERIACGPVDALKILAGERTVTDFHPHVDVDAARRLCGVEPKPKEPNPPKAEPAAEPKALPAESPADQPSDAEANKQAMEALRGLLEDAS